MTLGWIDSLCINKDSSSELDESIRSMYNWYQRASVCIAFLSETLTLDDDHKDSWYTRGWTLQELLAPDKTCFYSHTWSRLGSTTTSDVRKVVKKHTGITAKELKLCRRGHKEDIPISRRMQMACGRVVTREEDTSYSLMGLLGIEITIAYGEGSARAFQRLIAQIMATKADVLDLFNHQYLASDNLIPPSLDRYAYRRQWWNNYKYRGGSSLYRFRPIEPIILTHLGTRVPLLLIPGLLKTDNGDPYIAKGDFYGQFSAPMHFEDGSTLPAVYNILDKKLYEGNLGNYEVLVEGKPGLAIQRINVAGVFNFGNDNSGNILVPSSCAVIEIFWLELTEGQLLCPKDTMIGAPALRLARLKSKTCPSKRLYVIPRHELEDHGMQLVTLYL